MKKSFEEYLETLREVTVLSPIDILRLSRAKQKNNINLETFEYMLREKRLLRNYEETWKRYLEYEHDGIGLREFAYLALDEYIEDKKEQRIRKK